MDSIFCDFVVAMLNIAQIVLNIFTSLWVLVSGMAPMDLHNSIGSVYGCNW